MSEVNGRNSASGDFTGDTSNLGLTGSNYVLIGHFGQTKSESRLRKVRLYLVLMLICEPVRGSADRPFFESRSKQGKIERGVGKSDEDNTQFPTQHTIRRCGHIGQPVWSIQRILQNIKDPPTEQENLESPEGNLIELCPNLMTPLKMSILHEL